MADTQCTTESLLNMLNVITEQLGKITNEVEEIKQAVQPQNIKQDEKTDTTQNETKTPPPQEMSFEENNDNKIEQFNDFLAKIRDLDDSNLFNESKSIISDLKTLCNDHEYEKKLNKQITNLERVFNTEPLDVKLLLDTIMDIRYCYLSPFVNYDETLGKYLTKRNEFITANVNFNRHAQGWCLTIDINNNYRPVFDKNIKYVNVKINDTEIKCAQFKSGDDIVYFQYDSVRRTMDKYYYSLVNKINFPVTNGNICSDTRLCPYITYKKVMQDVDLLLTLL